MDFEDPRRRPVILRTGNSEDEPQPRSRRLLAWAGTGVVGLVAAAGLVAGGTAVWTAFDPGTPGRSPAPLWFSPPETIAPQTIAPETSARETSAPETSAPEATPTPDDHGGDRSPGASENADGGDGGDGGDGRGSGDERGDDKGGERVRPTAGTSTTSGKHDSDDAEKPGSDESGSGTSGSGTSGSGTSGSGTSGSGGSSDERSGDG